MVLNMICCTHGLSNFVVSNFCLQTSELFHSLSLSLSLLLEVTKILILWQPCYNWRLPKGNFLKKLNLVPCIKAQVWETVCNWSLVKMFHCNYGWTQATVCGASSTTFGSFLFCFQSLLTFFACMKGFPSLFPEKGLHYLSWCGSLSETGLKHDVAIVDSLNSK